MKFSILFPLGKHSEEVKPREEALPKGFVAYPQALLNGLTPEQADQQRAIYQQVYAAARAAAAGWQSLPQKEWPRAARN
jgi:hypothetical protein